MIIQDDKLPDLPPPANTVGAVGWIREHLISSPLNALLTVIAIYLLYITLPPALNWSIFDAVWTGTGRDDCLNVSGRMLGDDRCKDVSIYLLPVSSRRGMACQSNRLSSCCRNYLSHNSKSAEEESGWHNNAHSISCAGVHLALWRHVWS